MFNNLRDLKNHILEIILIGFILGVCSGIIGNIIFNLNDESILYTLFFTLFISGFTILILFIRILSKNKINKKINGSLYYSCTENRILGVINYPFANVISKFLQAAFKENKALLYQWDHSALKKMHESEHYESGMSKEVTLKARNLLKECVEYFILDQLVIFLTDYFNKEEFINSKNLQKVSRKEIPEFLFENRFLDLFSKDINEREGFLNIQNETAKEPLRISGSTGLLFNRFELFLPKNSKFKKVSDKIVIESNLYKLELGVSFNGTCNYTPKLFISEYLGIANVDDVMSYHIGISIKARVKPYAYFLGESLLYHEWIDDFLNILNDKVSVDSFFEKINWNFFETNYLCNKNRN